ncbi:Hpt domain-containing protein [Pleionea sediminis]|uniref:Hpt domain-containing protein n=1 Tax=Pleionea sediminis TaxID=2569479 RepID=UPI001FEADA18|nr:Hpt domain-containing protein [Pleionea sediminis]
MIQQLKDLLGDDFSTLVKAYDEDNRAILDSLGGLIKSGQSEEVARQIHSLKGASANIGAENLSQTCQTLEHNARAGDLSDAPELLATIQSQFEEAVTLLKEA